MKDLVIDSHLDKTSVKGIEVCSQYFVDLFVSELRSGIYHDSLFVDCSVPCDKPM